MLPLGGKMVVWLAVIFTNTAIVHKINKKGIIINIMFLDDPRNY